MTYKEIHIHSTPYVECDLKSGKINRTGNVNRCRIIMEENNNIFFDEEKFWVKDNKGIISSDNGNKWFFDSENDALICVAKGNISKNENILKKIKEHGFMNLTTEEQNFFKKHNKK